MPSLKDRFEGIANDGALSESEAVKILVQYNRELQSELKKVSKPPSKLDRILNSFLEWHTQGSKEGSFFSFVGAALCFCLCFFLMVTIGNWGFAWYKETTEGQITPEYYMSGRDERDGNGAIKNRCWYVDRLEEHATPCIENQEEALSILQRLEATRLNSQQKAAPANADHQ